MSQKAVLITGASRGIGAGIAEHFFLKGYHVFLNFQKNEQQAEALAASLRAKSGGSVELLGFNVASPQEVDQAFLKIQEKGIALDVLVNNAGICKDALLLRASPEQIESVLDVNLKGVIFCTKAASRLMIKQKKGSIIQIASVVGEMGNSGQSIYAASKAALFGFSKSIAQELSSRNIRVNVVSPGFIQTDMTDALSEEQKKLILKQIPLGFFGGVQDIAHAVYFLASEESRFITGQLLGVNGGQYM
jgi:3-oxoacyl-[acyl-carrier protein] reductase